MKKSLVSLIVAICALMCGCALVGCNGKEETVSGTGKVLWHYNVEFTAEVAVTVKNNKITEITVDPESYVTTGMAFTVGGVTMEWTEEVQNEYLSQYIGLTVNQIMAMEVRQPVDIMDHYDGGSLASDDVAIVTGATASSVVFAFAIQNAVAQLVEKQ